MLNKQISTALGFLIIILFVAGLIGVGFFVCDFIKEAPSKRVQKNNNTGVEEISYKKLEIKEQRGSDLPFCDYAPYTVSHALENGIVIDSQEEYDSFLEDVYRRHYENLLYHKENFPAYENVRDVSYEEFFKACNVFPEVDFSITTLLGKDAFGGGCNIDFDEEVYRDKEDKKVVYKITVIEEGPCDMAAEFVGWILIPKLSTEYDVLFKVEKN